MKLLRFRKDFSRLDAFRAIDIYKMNSILREDLRLFLNKNGEYVNQLDVESLLRRMDLDGDGRISFSEFCDFVHYQKKYITYFLPCITDPLSTPTPPFTDQGSNLCKSAVVYLPLKWTKNRPRFVIEMRFGGKCLFGVQTLVEIPPNKEIFKRNNSNKIRTQGSENPWTWPHPTEPDQH